MARRAPDLKVGGAWPGLGPALCQVDGSAQLLALVVWRVGHGQARVSPCCVCRCVCVRACVVSWRHKEPPRDTVGPARRRTKQQDKGAMSSILQSRKNSCVSAFFRSTNQRNFVEMMPLTCRRRSPGDGRAGTMMRDVCCKKKTCVSECGRLFLPPSLVVFFAYSRTHTHAHTHAYSSRLSLGPLRKDDALSLVLPSLRSQPTRLDLRRNPSLRMVSAAVAWRLIGRLMLLPSSDDMAPPSALSRTKEKEKKKPSEYTSARRLASGANCRWRPNQAGFQGGGAAAVFFSSAAQCTWAGQTRRDPAQERRRR